MNLVEISVVVRIVEVYQFSYQLVEIASDVVDECKIKSLACGPRETDISGGMA